MLKDRHIHLKLNTEKTNFKNPSLNDSKNFQKQQQKTKLYETNKKDNQTLNKSLITEEKRIQKNPRPFLAEDKKPKYNSQIKRKINKNIIINKQKLFTLSADKRKINDNNKKQFILKIDKPNFTLEKNNKDNKDNHSMKGRNLIKIKKMNINNKNMNINTNKKNNIKKRNIIQTSLNLSNMGLNNTSLGDKKMLKNIRKKITKEKNKVILEQKSSEKIKIHHLPKPIPKTIIKKKVLKEPKFYTNKNQQNLITKENGQTKIKNIIKGISNNNSSSNNPSKSSINNSSDQESNSEDKYRFKRNITNITDIISDTQKNEHHNGAAKILEFKAQNQENKNKESNQIIKNKKYLRRRSVDNPVLRERLEQYMNKMMLKQNGGNTLFLTNYEIGTSYEKEIDIIVNKQKIKKLIKISSCTKAGCSGPGIVKINQDSFFIVENFLGNENYFFLGVCDGHGDCGESLSNFVSEKLPNYLISLSNDEIISVFKKLNTEIYSNPDINSDMSGTTVVSLVITPEKLICINLGDSRLSLFKYDNGIYYSKNLSREHKPCELDESERIISNGGRLQKCFDEKTKKYFGPQRIWLKDKEEPGLAMTRSLGDKIAHNIGVIEEPEIKKFSYDGSEKFIIIASDGLWEYINSELCINIVKKFYEEKKEAKEAAMELTKEAFKKWKRKEVVIDDITVIVIFFY